MWPLLFPTVFWCDAPEAGLIGAVSLFKFRQIKHLVVAAIILDYPWSLLRGTEGSNPSPSTGESRANLTSSISDRNKGSALGVEDLDDLGKIRKRAGQPVDLVDDYDVDPSRHYIGEQLLQCGPIHRGA